jgi:AcrR family transcriptional regulator
MGGARVSDRTLLEAAERLLQEHGAAGLTGERVAAEAGISRVTLHRRGWNRGALLTALAESAEHRYRERMWPVLTADGSGLERLTLALKTLCELAEGNLGLLVALDEEANSAVFHERDGEGQEALTRTPFTEPLARLLADGMLDGSVRQVNAEEMATVLFNMVGWTYIHLRSSHRWSAERSCSATLDPLLAGLRADRAAA